MQKSWKEKCDAKNAKSSSTPSKLQTSSPLKSQLQSKFFESPKIGHQDRLGYSTPNRIHGNVTSRVKTELCPVIEVCTAATLPVSSPKSQSKSTKDKFEERIKKSALTPSKMLPITPNFYSMLLEEMAKHLQGMKVIDDTDHLTSFVYNNCLIDMTSTTSFRRGTFNTVFAFEIAMVGYEVVD